MGNLIDTSKAFFDEKLWDFDILCFFDYDEPLEHFEDCGFAPREWYETSVGPIVKMSLCLAIDKEDKMTLSANVVCEKYESFVDTGFIDITDKVDDTVLSTLKEMAGE